MDKDGTTSDKAEGEPSPGADADSGRASADPGLAARLRLAEAHRQNACRATNTTRAVLGSVAADLADIESHVAAALLVQLKSQLADLNALAENREAIDLLLRLAKQLVQLTQVDQQVARREEVPAEAVAAS